MREYFTTSNNIRIYIKFINGRYAVYDESANEKDDNDLIYHGSYDKCLRFCKDFCTRVEDSLY